MKIALNHSAQDYTIDLNSGIDLSIPNRFDGKNPIFYNAMQPRAIPVERDGFIGAVNRGGGCNVSVANVDIHCTGTHTECVGHIDDSGKKISDICPIGFLFTQLITVNPVHKSDTNESYHVDYENELVISVESFKGKLKENINALVIRTNPNDLDKVNRNYGDYPASFLTHDSIDYILDSGIKHLLVDLPSIDKADDGGQLGNHHRFFKLGKTISELLYIPDSVQDGFGFLQIQIPNWGLDAAPSRPIFYSVKF